MPCAAGWRVAVDVLACGASAPACDALVEIPAIGGKGRAAAGLTPLGTFLGLDPLD